MSETTSQDGVIASYRAGDGMELKFRHWPNPKAQATIVYLHGIQSHGGWYTGSCRRLAEEGYEVAFVDRRGSGLNQEDPGHVNRFRTLLDDLCLLVEHLGVKAAGRKLVVLGVSWGGKVACGLVRTYPGLVDALGLLCPGVFSKVDLPLGRRVRIGLASVFAPRRLYDIPLSDPALFTANPQRRQYIADDPLSLRRATARLLAESTKLGWYLKDAPRYITIPVVLFLAGEDRIIDNDRTRLFVGSFASRDKLVVDYEGVHHTLEFEEYPRFFFDDLANWVNRVTRLP